MAYFSNGTEGEMYQDDYCMKCKNWRDRKDGRGEGCPIWDLHVLYAYDECNGKGNAKDMLDTLIPMKELYADECSMFLRNINENPQK